MAFMEDGRSRCRRAKAMFDVEKFYGILRNAGVWVSADNRRRAYAGE